MKQLILFRHAKSSWDDDVGDADRPLAGRGERDAPRMGKRLKARAARARICIVASHATRAQRTAELVAKALGIKRKEVRTERALYLASPDDILGVVAAQDDSLSCLLVVGHNPGLTELVNRLLPDLALDNLPTSGAVAIDLSTTSWSSAASAARGRKARLLRLPEESRADRHRRLTRASVGPARAAAAGACACRAGRQSAAAARARALRPRRAGARPMPRIRRSTLRPRWPARGARGSRQS